VGGQKGGRKKNSGGGGGKGSFESNKSSAQKKRLFELRGRGSPVTGVRFAWDLEGKCWA